jgi:hypothetical protein
MFKNPFKANKTDQKHIRPPNALYIGMCKESNQPQYIEPSKAFGHTSISGQLGSGAKILMQNMVEDQVENGGGLVYLDIQGGAETLERLYEKAKSENRVDDLLIIDIQHPEKSNTYNPLKNGNSAEIAQKISCFFKHVEMKSPKIPCVSIDINEIHTIILALQKLEKDFGINTIRQYVDKAGCKGLLDLHKELVENNTDVLLSASLHEIIKKYKINTDEPNIDQGFENFISHYGACSQVLKSLCFSADSDVDFIDVLKNKKIVYIDLNGFANKHSAETLAQLILLDLRACLDVVGGDFAKKAELPFIFFSNDCLSLVDHFWARLYGYTNPSQFQMIHANQTPLEAILNKKHKAHEYGELILGNTENRIYFKLGMPEHNGFVSDAFGYLVQATINTFTKEVREHSKTPILPVLKLESLSVGEALHFKEMALQSTLHIQ